MGIAAAIREAAIELPSRVQSAGLAGPGARRRQAAAVIEEAAGTARVSGALDRLGSTLLFRKGQSVVQQGDLASHVFKVASGALRVVRLMPDGRRHIASFLMPGDFFGLADLESYGHSVEAITDSTLLRYTRSGLEGFLDRDMQMRRQVFGVMCRELSAVQDHLLLLGRKTATERLATFLLAMAERRSPHRPGEDRQVELPMNRSDVADYLGLRIETVCRVLADLKQRRIIDMPDVHSIVILRRDTLEDLSAGDSD
jgi:CRP/FNR family transcriptional regulator, anaerobic regulatory protein